MQRNWMSTTRAANYLGVSAKYLLKHRGGLFKNGEHWLSLNPEAWRPTYRWDVIAMSKLLGQPDAGAQLDQRLGR